MSWTIQGNPGGGEKAPIGNHPAVLVGIIDLGTQWQNGYNGEPGKWEHRAFFVWELVQEKKANGFNHTIGIDLKLSFHEKSKLRKWVEARSGKRYEAAADFDVSAELGQPCLLNVVANAKGYPKVDNVGPLPKGMTVPTPMCTPTAIPFKAAAEPEIPTWVPWLYGQRIQDVIGDAKENGGKEGGTQAGNGQASVGSTAPPASAGGPPPAPPGSYLDDQFWVHNQPALPATTPHTRKAIADWLPASGADAATVMLCKQGDSGWRPATEYGFVGAGF